MITDRLSWFLHSYIPCVRSWWLRNAMVLESILRSCIPVSCILRSPVQSKVCWSSSTATCSMSWHAIKKCSTSLRSLAPVETVEWHRNFPKQTSVLCCLGRLKLEGSHAAIQCKEDQLLNVFVRFCMWKYLYIVVTSLWICFLLAGNMKFLFLFASSSMQFDAKTLAVCISTYFRSMRLWWHHKHSSCRRSAVHLIEWTKISSLSLWP